MSRRHSDSVMRAAREQYPELFTEGGGKVRPTTRIDWQRKEAQARGAQLEVRNEALLIKLPDVKLPSVNRLIGSRKKDAQKEAKHSAQMVLWTYKGQLWRFTEPVYVAFVQVAPIGARLIDVDNLYTKHILDALTKSGVGVIEDDSPKHVVRVVKEYWLNEEALWGLDISINPAGDRRQ